MRIFIYILLSGFLTSCSHYPRLRKANNGIGTKEPANNDSSSKKAMNIIVIDTAAYAKGIMENKERYIGKEFGVLLDDLKIPPKSYFGTNARKNVSVVPYTDIYFDDIETTDRKIGNFGGLDNPVSLQIIWKTPLSFAEVTETAQTSHGHGNWQAPEQEFYSKQVVGDILYHFNNRK